MKRLVWTDGRFSWWLVAACGLLTAGLLWFDWYWRTHDTSFAEWF